MHDLTRPALLLLLGAAPIAAPTTLRQVRCLDHTYDYQLYTPAASAPLPAILLLHGAGGRSSDLLDTFQPLAAREHIALIAPQIPRELWFEKVAPAVFRCLVEDAKHAVPLDAQRIYLFGYSMGGYLTYDAAMFASTYFAGAGVYAAAIADEYYAIVDSAARKIPVAIYIGSRDQYYSLDQVRRTRDLLTSHGFPVHYLEFPGQDHRFAPVGAQVSADAWSWLSAFTLPSH